jgi:hypothetical protein
LEGTSEGWQKSGDRKSKEGANEGRGEGAQSTCTTVAGTQKERGKGEKKKNAGEWARTSSGGSGYSQVKAGEEEGR